MLISLSIENWRSFKEKTTISMLASKQRKHAQRIPYVPKYHLHILPIAAIYGGNASGKSNIISGLDFAEKLIRIGTKIDEKIDVEPFELCEESRTKPSKFWFEVLIDEIVYEYSFAVNTEKICEEKLIEIKPNSERPLFERSENQISIYDLDKDKNLDFIKKGTRVNQLFLTNCIEQNNEKYKHIYDWFKYCLYVIKPETRYDKLEIYFDKSHPLYDETNNLLDQLDTGLSRLGAEEVKDLKIDELKDQKLFLKLLDTISGERYFNYNSSGKEIIKKLVSYHKCEDGTEIKFDIDKESDGTRRLLDILPAFVSNAPKKDTNPTRVFFIDEIDRSLHHLLIRRLLNKYFSECNKDSRNQIVFTTHDLLLMDQELLRKDEMYLVEKNQNGVSSIIPLNEYKYVRSDKDILKSYMQGRFGGIPRLS